MTTATPKKDTTAKKSSKAKEADQLMEQLPEDVKMAIEAMRRTTRVRRVSYAQHNPSVKYEETE